MITRPGLSADKKALLERRLRGVEPESVEERVIPRRREQEWAPLSFSQRQMWVIDQMNPGNPAYNLPVGYRLKGSLDSTALEKSFNEIIKRHEVLRTSFAVRDGEPIQLIHSECKIKIDAIGLEELSDGERETRLQALASAESVKSFDLSRLPLIRVSLFRLGQAEHVLIVNLHHIVADGMSVGLILDELDAFYRIFTGGGGPRPPDLPVQYPDFALWQRLTMAGEAAMSGQIEFWQKQLGDGVAPLELPGDIPRPALQSFKGSNVFFDIDSALTQELRSLGAREGCTLFMTLLAAFLVLLHRYSDAEDIVVGTPVARRSPSDVEPLIGNFLNMIALRCGLSGEPTFVELMGRCRDATLNAFSNSDVPFEAVMRHLTFERDPSRNPVFQVLMQVLSTAVPRIGDLDVDAFHFDLKIAQFDLGLHLYETPEGYLGRFEYCADLFHANTVERLSSNFQHLLRAIVGNPWQRMSEIPMLAESERNQILGEWNDTAVAFPGDMPLQGRFEAQVERTPERIALADDSATLTYAELDARANRIAQALRSRRVGRGHRVGLCVERGADMLAAVLGVLKAGAAYVPLDPAFPEDRLRFMAEDAQVSMLVSSMALAGSFALPRERQLLLDADAAALAAHSGQRLAPDDALDARPDDPAYVIYTSGSTGKPKGVVVPHRPVVNFLTSMARKPGMTADDVLVAVTTLSFDIAVLELQLPLTLGARVVIAGRDDVINRDALRSLLERHRATVMQATPSTWRLLLDAGWKAEKNFRALVGGEALPKDLADQLIASGVELWNMYGPTETTVWSTCARIADTSNGITIGNPIDNTVVWILDAHKNLCPIGVPGELCIGGDGVSLGYWNRPELTAERFIPDPFGVTPGRRLYRTGDRARWRSDGMLEHLGRLDDQVKVRGFRIELGEIEAVLCEHPSVRQAAVHLWTVKANDERIVACCVPATGQTLAPISLRRHLRARLPDYMVPQYFLPLDAIPLTPTGKVDRRKLPIPVVTDSRIGREEAPSGSSETAIANIWAKLIHPQRPISRLDKFFEIGGHSLLGVQAIGQIEDALGVKLEFRVLFQDCLAEIAMRCRPDSVEVTIPSPQAN